MWDSTPHTSCSWEPAELRILKQELANLTCKCNTCENFNHPPLHHRGYKNDEAVQVEQKSHLLDRYIYADTDIPPHINDPHPIMMDYIRKDLFCPNCYFIWDLLRRTTKVFKDVESEMKPDSSDKSTEKGINLADSTTSVTNKPPHKLSSNIMLADYISESSSCSSLIDRGTDSSYDVPRSVLKKGNHDRVTFLEDYSKEKIDENPPTFTMMHGNCFCLENYMDTIRPPLNNVL